MIFLPLGGNTTPCLTLKPWQFFPNPHVYDPVLNTSETLHSKHQGLPLITSQSMRCFYLSHPPFLILVILQDSSKFHFVHRSSCFNQHPSHSLRTHKISLSMLPVNHILPCIVLGLLHVSSLVLHTKGCFLRSEIVLFFFFSVYVLIVSEAVKCRICSHYGLTQFSLLSRFPLTKEDDRQVIL